MAQVNVRLPVELLAVVRRHAMAADLGDAAWIRTRLVALLGADATTLNTVPVRRSVRSASSVDVVAIAQLRESVGEAVGTLRQVAGLDRARSGAKLAEIDDAITRLVASAKALDDAKARLLDVERMS